MSLQNMLQAQIDLQAEHMVDGDPRYLDDDRRAHFIQWNFTALVVELGEAMAEVGWKPWATDRTVHHKQFAQEMVDAWHFFMNMLVAGSGVQDPAELAAWFQELYYAKRKRNADRQIEGYDGVTGKCPNDHRDLFEVPQAERFIWKGLEYCSKRCAEEAT